MGRARGGSNRRRRGRGRGRGGPPPTSVAPQDELPPGVAVAETGPSVARPAEPSPSGSSTSVARPAEPVPSRGSTSVARPPEPIPSRSSTSVTRPAKPGLPCSGGTWCSPPVQTTQHPDDSYLGKFLLSTTLKESSVTVSSSPYSHPVAQGTTEGRCSPLAQTTQQRDARARGGNTRRRRGRGRGGPPHPSVARPEEPAPPIAVGETGPSVTRPAEPGPPCSSDTWRSPPVQTTQQPDASYLSKFLLSTVAQSTTEGRCSPLAQTMQRRDVSYLSNFMCSTTLKESSITASSLPYPHPVAQGTIEDPPLSRRHLSLGPPIFVLKPLFWYFTFYIRTSLSGSFHTYPDLGRPFKSLREAENAIDCHLNDLRDPKMREESLDQLSAMERCVRLSLYWPDGTMKSRSKPLPIDKGGEPTPLMVQAFVDQYNEYHNLPGDLAYELEDVLCDQFFVSENERYIHVNFTTKTKGVDCFDRGIENLFFAEGKFIQGKYHQEIVVSCIRIVEPQDNGHCYGCKSTRSIDMKHPNEADAYSGGHVNGYSPVGGFHAGQDDFDSLSIEAKEKRLRRMFKGFDDPEFLRNLNPIVSHQTGVAEQAA